MMRLDLDDLPARIATQLSQLPEGEELVLVQHGAVVRRLIPVAAPVPPQTEPNVEPEQTVREVFENFRSAIEDEF